MISSFGIFSGNKFNGIFPPTEGVIKFMPIKITEVIASYSQTLQYRQFEPICISITAKAEVNVGEDPKKVFHDLFKTVQEKVESEVQKKKITRKESFLNQEDGLEIAA